MRIILCGQGNPSIEVLRQLIDSENVSDLAVYTHQQLVSDPRVTPLYKFANDNGIFRSTQDVNEAKLPFEPDMIISIYYRKIIGKELIDRVGGCIFNAHGSLLPRHRGRSPIPWAIIEGDQVTGVTYHYIDGGVDTGPIILQSVIQIDASETQTTLFEKIDRAVVEFFPAAFNLVLNGFPGVPQVGEASHNHAGVPYGGEIDPCWPIGKIKRFIRAMTYPPLPYAKFDGKEIKTELEYNQALYERSQRNNNVTVS